MKHVVWLIPIILVLPGALLSQTEEQPKDLVECIEQIRAWGISEWARISLQTIAGIRLGGRILSFQKDEQSGAYFHSYTGTKCYSPDRKPEEVALEREQYQYQVDGEIIKLRPLADADSSGFVSTSEGMEFRNLAEFGYKAAYVIEAEEGRIDRICQGLMMDEKAFREMLAKYRELTARAKRFGIEDMPAVAFD